MKNGVRKSSLIPIIATFPINSTKLHLPNNNFDFMEVLKTLN